MGFLLLLTLLGLPIAEIWLMIEVGDRIGALPTVALILGTAVLGAILFRIQGMATLGRVQAHVERGETPVGELLSGLGLLVAGVLLLIPGFLTDVVGLILFVPPVRRFLIGAGIAWTIARGATRVWTATGRDPTGGPEPHGPTGGSGPVIDGEFHDVTDRPEHGGSDRDRSGDSGPDQLGGPGRP